MSRRITVTAVILLLVTGCGPTRVAPGSDLAPLVGRRVSVAGVVAAPAYFVTGSNDPGGWCLTLSGRRPALQAESTVALGEEPIAVRFRSGTEPAPGAREVVVMGRLERLAGEGARVRFAVIDATWADAS